MRIFHRVKKYHDPDNETEIVVVHKEEPPSGSRLVLALFFMLLAMVTIGQQFYYQGQRSNDLQAQQSRDAQFRASQQQLNQELQQQITKANNDQDRLRKLVLALLESKSPEDSKRILKKFAEETTASEAPGVMGGSPIPGPSPQASPSAYRHQNGGTPNHPSARPSASGTRSPTPRPRPTPSPSCLVPSPAPCTTIGVLV